MGLVHTITQNVSLPLFQIAAYSRYWAQPNNSTKGAAEKDKVSIYANKREDGQHVSFNDNGAKKMRIYGIYSQCPTQIQRFINQVLEVVKFDSDLDFPFKRWNAAG